MAFTLKTTLTTVEPPNVAIFLGPADARSEYEITGKLEMYVEKAVMLDRLIVAFNGDAYNLHDFPQNGRYKSENGNIARSEFNIIQSPVEFPPGNYDWPFRLRIPADVATTNCKRLQGNFFWAYELITLGIPSASSGGCPRQFIRQPLVLKRVHLLPTPRISVFRTTHPNALECIVKLPTIVDIKDHKVKLSIQWHPLGEKFRGVKDIVVEGIQTEECKFEYARLALGLRRFWITQPTVLYPEDMTRPGIIICDPPHWKGKNYRTITKNYMISNPNKKSAIATWGTDSPIEHEIEINPKHLIPTEEVEWVSVTHKIRLRITFVDLNINPMLVNAPIKFGNIVDN
ncbi:hypothetical protein BGX21_010260 [Mortierella sp. AD011]|nr:hypothetical protein BGX21_010260 [Mortierella sp. AD011]